MATSGGQFMNQINFFLHLVEVIQARNNNIGNGNLYAEGRLNPVPGVADVNECAEPELHDCDPDASRY